MAFSSWRGSVGIIRPTLRPGGLEELIRMLPEGIGIVPLFNPNHIRGGGKEEFAAAIAGCETATAQLAEAGVELVTPSGAPPFMVLGYEAEQELVRQWERRYNIEIFTTGMNHIAALRALGIKRFVGASYFRGEINRTYAKYFEDAGFEVLDMAGMDVDFNKAQELPSNAVYRFVKERFLAQKGADGIYMLGAGWRTLDVIEKLEGDCGVPVMHAVPALSWEIQRRLHVRVPVTGLGRLVREMPSAVD